MDRNKIPKKYKSIIKEVTEKLVLGNEFAAAVDSALSDSDSWKDFQSILYDDMQSYINDARKIQKVLCR